MTRMNKIAASLALILAAGAANAAIVEGVTGNTAGDVLLLVYSANGNGYVRDLGNIATIESTGTIASAALGADANWNTFAASVTGNAVTWGIFGQDLTGAGDTMLSLTGTAAADQTALVNGNFAANSNGAAVGTNINAINALGAGTPNFNTLGSAASNIGSVLTFASDTTSNAVSLFNGYKGGLPILTGVSFGSALGASQNLWGASTNNNGVFANVTADKFGNFNYNFGNYSLTAAGGLASTAAVAAVPEPGTWALFLAGMLTVGAIARRRQAA